MISFRLKHPEMGSATSATSYPNRQKPPTNRPSRLSNTSLRRSDYRPIHDTAFPSKVGDQRQLHTKHPSHLETRTFKQSSQPTERPAHLGNVNLYTKTTSSLDNLDTAFPKTVISKVLLPTNHPGTLANSYQHRTQDQSHVSYDNNNLKMGDSHEYENNLEIIQERLRPNATEYPHNRALPLRIKPHGMEISNPNFPDNSKNIQGFQEGNEDLGEKQTYAGFSVHSDRNDQPTGQQIRYLRKPRMKIGPEFMFENPENTTYSDNGEFVLEPVTNEQ